MSEEYTCLVFIPDRVWTPDEVRQALGGGPLTTEISGADVLVRWYGEIELALRCFDQRLAPIAPPPGAPAWVRQAAGRIELRIPDLDAALEQANTLIETQLTLQATTGGAVYLTWNDEWMLPDEQPPR